MKPVFRPGLWLGLVILVVALAPPPASALIFDSQAAFLATLPAECSTTSPPPNGPSCFLENFNGLAEGYYPSPLGISGAHFSYTVDGGEDLILFDDPDRKVTTSFSGLDIEIDFTASPTPVKAVGGNFFTVSDQGIPSGLSLNLIAYYSDGDLLTARICRPTLTCNRFLGITGPSSTSDTDYIASDVHIDRLVIQHVFSGAFTALDNLMVGVLAPLPPPSCSVPPSPSDPPNCVPPPICSDPPSPSDPPNCVTPPPSGVPEPSSVLLFGAAGIGWWAGRRRSA